MRNALATLALVAAGALTLALLYGLAQRTVVPRTSPPAPAADTTTGPPVVVEVRNGAGVSGLAATAAQHLRAEGFDVVEAGNHAERDVPESYVADRAGKPEAARRVAAALGLPADRVRPLPDSSAYVDAAVVLGRDYAALTPFSPPPNHLAPD